MPDVNQLGTTPVGATPNNIPGHLQALKDTINTGSILRRLTQAQIDGLSSAQKPIGVTVHNLTTGKSERWNGSAWVPVDGSDRLPLSGGNMTGAIGTASGDLLLAPGTGGQVMVGPNASKPVAHSDATNANQSATLGQVTAAAGVASAAAAAAQSTANAALPKAGGTMTGDLSVVKPSAQVFLDTTADSYSAVAFRRAGVTRWHIFHRASTTGELVVDRYSAAGAYQSSPLTIGADGAITFTDAPAHPDAVSAGESATLGQVTTAAGAASAAAAAAQGTANAALPAARVKAGVWSGTTAVDGQVSIALGSPPAGTSWSFLPVGVKPVTCQVVSVSADGTAVVQTSVNSTAASFHWHAIAY